MTTENIALQAWRKDISYILHAVQGESDSRTFNFILYDQTGAVISLTGKTVAFYVQKPDGNIVMLATTTSGSTISVTLTLQACAVPGVMPCWIQLVDENGDDLRVDSLLLEVQACDFDGAVESSSEFTALQEALGDVAKFNSHITDYNNPHQVNGNQIRTGVIRGEAENGPYFDLDADNGRGELAATSLINTTASPTATIQIVDQTEYFAADFNGGDSTSRIQLQLSKDYTGSFDPYKRCELVAMGDLNIRANSTTTIPMGYNSIELHGNSTTNEGNISIYRGTQGQQREQVIYAGENNTVLQYKPNSDQNAQIYLSNAKISLNTGGYARASIENDGAHFGDIYQNGNKVVSYDELPMDDLPQARSNLGMGELLSESAYESVHASYGYLSSFSFWQSGMSTFEFLTAMPDFSYVKVVGNPDANFSDAPCEYCQYELLKGSANYKAGWAHMVSSTPANSLFHYCAGAGTEGFWGKVSVTKV